MNVGLLKFIDRKVRIVGDITHQEYQVLGLFWETEKIILAGDTGNFSVHHSKLELVPEWEEI